MGYNVAYAYVNCYACGRHSLAETMVELLDLPMAKVLPLIKDVEKERVEVIDVRGKLELPKGVGPLVKAHRRYLTEQRGFDPDKLVKLWGIGGIAMATQLSWRIFIPIHYRGQVVSWTTRSIGGVGLRYVSARADQEAINHKTLLYGEDYVRHGVIVHEGTTDAWAVGPGAVATCGTGFTRAQVRRISKYPVRAICFDNVPEAQERARELCDLLTPFDGETCNVVLDAKDAATAPKRDLRRLRKEFLE